MSFDLLALTAATLGNAYKKWGSVVKTSHASRQRLWLVVTAAITVVCLATAVGAWATGVHAWHLLVWAGLAGAVVFVVGLVVPAAISRQHRRAAELVAEQERLAQVGAGLRAVMRPLTIPAGPYAGLRRFGGSPAALLRADRQVVGFTGRMAELRGLRSWAHGSSRGVVRLITGPGGSGKTRLAVEFAAELEAEGWQCGLLKTGHGEEAVASIKAAGKPTMLVVDYAEARADLEALLEGMAAHDGDPVIRVLLLARALGEWWEADGPLRRHAAIRDVLAGAEAVELGPLTGIQLRHQETFHAALEAFANYYEVPVPPAGLRLVPKDTPVLLLHTAALVAVLKVRDGTGIAASMAATGDVVTELLGHESNYWSQTASAHGLDKLGMGSGMTRQVIAITGLLGAEDEQEARWVLRRLPVLVSVSEPTLDRFLSWLRELYPTSSSSWLGTIQPDLLLEYLVTSVFSGSRELDDVALTGLPEGPANHALEVLARSLDHYPAAAQALLRRLLMGHADVLAIAAVRLARNLDNAVFGQLLADVLTEVQLTTEVTTALADELGQMPISLTMVKIAITLQVGVGQIAAGQWRQAADTAATITSAAGEFSHSGRLRIALAAARAAVALYRALEEAEPGRYHANLANGLGGLASALYGLGQNRDALDIVTEALELYRALEEAEPGRYRPELANAVLGLGAVLSSLGQESDSRSAKEEAVELYRALEEAEPGPYRAYLARALTNLGLTLDRLGESRAARPIAAEAVELYRALEEAEPGRYRVNLAIALTNLGVILSSLGQQRDARPIEEEAVELHRALEEAEPGRYRVNLALALTSLGHTLDRLGESRAARPVEAEAVELHRALEEAEPGRYRPEFARALTNLGVTLSSLGQARDARPIEAEAVELCRALEEAEPGRYRPDLARTLENLGLTLNRLGESRGARPIVAEAVELYRALEEAEPGRYRPDLAIELTHLGVTLSSLGQDRDARPIEAEAVELYRALAEAEPGRYRAELAVALTRLGATLSKLHQLEQALIVTLKAVRKYRLLFETDQATYQARLADTLIQSSGILLDLGRLEEASDAKREADLYGRTS